MNLLLETIRALLEVSEDQSIAYKVMRMEDGHLVSGANSQLKFPLKRGAVLNMPGQGVYMSPTKNYVLQYYSELAPVEALLKLAYNPDEIISGNLEDREPEISVQSAIIVDYSIIRHDEEDY